MTLEEMKLTTELYKQAVLHKMKQDQRYCKEEILSDCLDAAAYLFSQIELDDTKQMYDEMFAKHSEQTLIP